ncbi:MAG: GNAT family N-acetyltransferase [Eubacterium sp.]|nr:GNAT family N-acetyltransferase [Eubacterium sp.]
MTFETERLIIQTSDTALTDQLLKYYSDNRVFFSKHEPEWPEQYYTRDYQRQTLEMEMRNMANRTSAYYYYSLKDDPERIIGSISFVRIRKEPYASVIFGYNQHEAFQGHGYCTEACAAAIRDVILFAHIHRIESRVLTDNEKSVHIMEKLGFVYEGMEYGGVLIGGVFRDHYRYAWINPEY